MPRLGPRILRRALSLDPLLPLLLRECRDLRLAGNELRWLRQHALSNSGCPDGWRRLRDLCRMRSRGVPLQYLLGDQPFGELEILCRRGVLIPRPETESYTYHTADLILRNILRRGHHDGDSLSAKPLRVIDLCTGTGCISLLLHALLASHFRQISILGVDLSPAAVALANRNLEHNLRRGLLSNRARSEVHFRRADVLGLNASGVPGVEDVLEADCDVLISNPPYISPASYHDGTTSRSVRIFEPALALVPPNTGNNPGATPNPGDLFYHHLVALASKLRARLTVLECGDRMQAERVVGICRGFTGAGWQAEIYPSEGEVGHACAVVVQKTI